MSLPASTYPDPHLLNVDLHCHSNVSDGLLPPDELVTRAIAQGVQLLALTDHDEVGGIAAAQAAAKQASLPFVCGVEISVTFCETTVHIVGLNIDPQHPALVQGLEATRGGRTHRAHEIADGLAKVGIPDAFEGALKYAGNPDLIGRTHFARFIVEQGVCKSVRDVFTKYLVPGKPGYVPMRWASLADSVQWITSAGGQAVIAHPGRYKLTDLQHQALMENFKEAGGVGIEVITGSHTVDQYHRYALVAKELGFLASRGSDFHGPEESRVDLGELPRLPDSVVPIWHDWPITQTLMVQAAH